MVDMSIITQTEQQIQAEKSPEKVQQVEQLTTLKGAIRQRAFKGTYTIPFALKKFVQTMLTLSDTGNKLEAERLTGVDRNRFYWHYRHHQEFRDWYSNQCDLLVGSNESIASKKLIALVNAGDVTALRLYFELKGKIGRNSSPIFINNNRVTNAGDDGRKPDAAELAADRKRLLDDFRKYARDGNGDLSS